MGVKTLAGLAGINQEFAQKGAFSVNSFLDDQAAAGHISQDFLPTPEERRAKAGKDVSATRYLLAEHGGIRLKGPDADTAGVFFPDTPDHVPGAENLFGAFIQEVYDRAAYGPLAAEGTFFSEPGSDGSFLFPTVQAPGIIDERAEPRNQVSLGDLLIATTGINGDSYRGAYVEHVSESDDSMEPSRVAEGAELPRYKITTGDRSISIYKYGAAVEHSYEVVRRMRLNIVQITLQEIARQEALRKRRAAIDVALNGDGNSNPAQDVDAAGTTWAPQDFDTLEGAMNRYDREPVLLIGDETQVNAVRGMRYPTANFPLTPDQIAMYGNTYMTPSGRPLRYAPAGSALDGAEKLLARANGGGLVMVRENGSIIREADRFITRQVQVLTMSENVGFMKPNAFSFFTLTLAES